MKRLILTSCTVLVWGLLSTSSEAEGRPPRVEFRGTFGTAKFCRSRKTRRVGVRASLQPDATFQHRAGATLHESPAALQLRL